MVQIRFKEIQIASLSRASAVHSGDNRVQGFRHADRTNQAFGTADGADLFVDHIRTVLADGDDSDLTTGSGASATP